MHVNEQLIAKFGEGQTYQVPVEDLFPADGRLRLENLEQSLLGEVPDTDVVLRRDAQPVPAGAEANRVDDGPGVELVDLRPDG